MQCRDVEAVVEQEDLAPLPKEVTAHLAECRECRNYVADLTSIVDVARKMPSEISPPERVWISLRAQLELEGIIREPVVPRNVEPPPWWRGFTNLFRGRTLATAAVGLLIVAGAVLELRTNHGVSESPSPVAPEVAYTPFVATRTTLNEQEPLARGMILASTSPVDESLRENLKKVDEFIAECERRVNAEPRDQLAREYLSEAYQQKAELLSAMLDRGRSIN
ncbi:MAG TPA: anti-sigma factor [Candidatus Acidoferrum sp.]|nr:anti-sigma factor [Candidatus Acidoferrum sp.]